MAGQSMPEPDRSPGRYARQRRQNLTSVEQAARAAQWEALRRRYQQEFWTRKDCAIPGCGEQRISLHHATYGQPRTLEILALVPMCAPHHHAFERDVWPAAQGQIPRWLATLNWVLHGEPLLTWVEWAQPVLPEFQGAQVPLWDVGP